MGFSGTFVILVAQFVTVLIASNILAVKLFHLGDTGLFQWWAKIAYEALATPLNCAVVA